VGSSPIVRFPIPDPETPYGGASYAEAPHSIAAQDHSKVSDSGSSGARLVRGVAPRHERQVRPMSREMHRAVTSSSGSPTDLRRSECLPGSHQPQKLRSRALSSKQLSGPLELTYHLSSAIRDRTR
jgi:hypothetical protein